MKVLISGSSSGIGLAVCKKFLNLGHEVYGLDIEKASIDDKKYHHYICDISKKEELPDIDDIEILFNNAGKQNSDDDILNNLIGTINVTEKYAFQKKIKSVLFNASASSISGDEFPKYVASKSGIIGYMLSCAKRLTKYLATCNAISLGGVLTKSNECVIKDKKYWDQIMKVTPLKKWMSEEEVCDWVIFLTLTNKSMSGENILIDNGEMKLNSTFVWPKK